MTIRPFMGGSEGGDSPPGEGALPESVLADPVAQSPDQVIDLSDPADSTDELIDPSLDDSVAEAMLGDAAADNEEAQPDRKLSSTSDFASIYIRSRRALEQRARSFLSDPRDIEEVVQETFLRLVLAMPELEYEWQAHAFCRRALTNLCIDRYRRDRRRPQVFDLDAGNIIDLAADDYADHPVLRAEDAGVVREALSRLSPLHRAALVKREIEEKPLSVIAAELDVPEESVKHLLFRARRSLRRLLTGSAVDPDADLSLGELAAVANKRIAQATLRSGYALVVFVTAALVVAAGSQGLLPHRAVAPNRGPGAGEPTADRQQPRAVSGPRTARPQANPAAKRRTAAAPASSTHAPHAVVPTGTSAPSGSGSQGIGTHGTGPGNTPADPAPKPSSPPPAVPPAAAASGPFHSSQAAGAKGPYTVTVSGQTYTASAAMHTRPASGQTASGSDLSVANATRQGGSYAVSQQVVSAPTSGTPQIQDADVTVSLPVASAGGPADQATYQLADPDVAVEQLAAGAVRVTMTGTAAQADGSESAPANAPAAVQVSVSVTYLAGLTQISGEQVTLAPLTGVGPFDAPASLRRLTQTLPALLPA